MGKIAVRDAYGDRWSIGARRLRVPEIAPPLSGPEQDSLRRRLAGAVAPNPAVVPDPMRGVPGAWRMPADRADVELHETRADLASRYRSSNGIWALVALVRLVEDVVDHRRTPKTDNWRLEAAAGGRIRRWARWEVDGPEAAQRAAATVAAALAAGQVPAPSDAVLAEVVDQRPPTSRRQSAGLGGTPARR